MGNEQKDDRFYMRIQIIGEGMDNFYNNIKTTKKYKTIKEYWEFEIGCKTLNEQIEKYFKKLEEKKKRNINMRESTIIKVNNVKESIIDDFLKKMNDLKETYYMPLVLILYENEIKEKFKIDEEKYDNLDQRLFFIEKYDDNRSFIEDKIEPILLRFCSIHNELGDRIHIKEKEDYDLIDNYFPFNLNIACIGRFGQGKSTGVNAILNEYKAKESSKGVSQTKYLTYYQVSNKPIRILDIPGFEDKDTVEQAIRKFKLCGEEINKLKDNLHIILFFLNYHEKRAFSQLEVPILEEIFKHKSSKIIYVITHSKPDVNENQRNKIYERINSGLKGLFNIDEIEENEEKYNKFESTKDNTVLVNFLKDKENDYEPFGKDILFETIHKFFIESDDYKESLKKLDSDTINKNLEKLRKQANDIVLSNKIWGGVVGIIPGIDWLLQKFVIKKNAAKKVGKIFGIDVKFIREEQNKTNKEKEEKEEKKEEIDIIGPNIEKKSLDLEIKGENLTTESNNYMIKNSIKVTTETGVYVGSGFSLVNSVGRIATEAAAESAVFGLRVAGAGLAVFGIAIGVGLGGYFTSKYCQELIDLFSDYYKKNADKINNSYKQAAYYFSNDNEEDSIIA